MPEPDRLEKLIEQRKQQERKNDKLRVHKNKIENDRLKAQSAYFEWYKELRQREFESKEGVYMRKLERIYDRQLQIEEGRRREEEKKEEKRAIILERRASLVQSAETQERETRKQMHGIKQERVKSFMSKARMLSTGYRDNDPPQAYYKRNGIVPPDRFVTPEMSANAQASFGGGSRPPASSEHLYKQKLLPRETPYGITVTDHLIRDSARSRTDSAFSRSDRLSVTTLDDDVINSDDELIDEVIRVQVKLRPSTAPGKRKVKGEAAKLLKSGVITQLSNDDQSEVCESNGGEGEIEQRPSTAMATVRFTEESKEKAAGRQKSSNSTNARRRGSLRPQSMMMFRRRSQSSASSAATQGGRRSASATPRGQQRGGHGQQQLMSNAEQERIRRKMREKALCLESERINRAFIAETGLTPRSRRLASASPRLVTRISAWRAVTKEEPQVDLANSKRRRSVEHREAMLKYVKRCQRGAIMGDSLEAQHILLSTTQRQLASLQTEVNEFVGN